ncbi:Fur family transcriptional regulator, peroxide stress response regulator [Desulfofustis glycolicus DSM 9705]|uniref:Fur family transcriptional regulator, peroxide stress response regulator n=1 Tax=Desulfofustis glycolicus DSM 9705 TaxID=1121409 RepID=A0A1M5X5N1_9BACT|nr:Fur family transcriptional regulator, peroxide stress response regulator [Desulfofustis glycolicus DSM 9705]
MQIRTILTKEQYVNIGKKEVEQRMRHFEAVCREAGIKLTHQRMEIFREIAQTGDHPDVDRIFQRIRRRLPTVSLDTVYRTLWLLNDLGLVKTLGSSREATRFDANLEKHHHFICKNCGYTRDFVSSELDNLTLPESLQSFGEVEATHIEVRGVCRECIARERIEDL